MDLTRLTKRQLIDLLKQLTQNGRRDDVEMKQADPEEASLVERLRAELRWRTIKTGDV